MANVSQWHYHALLVYDGMAHFTEHNAYLKISTPPQSDSLYTRDVTPLVRVRSTMSELRSVLKVRAQRGQRSGSCTLLHRVLSFQQPDWDYDDLCCIVLKQPRGHLSPPSSNDVSVQMGQAS